MELDAFHRMYLAATNSAPPPTPQPFPNEGGERKCYR